mmetsp:Transcript_21390/g.21515  ORF Transcript_21390/g.21515 Transcript_21390/m.21515 type:complete len:231 (+) Transcript_21390:41-733(+)|eukprot:CAMPEP_0182421936 /NCGR_PEP_ID=MMETSP1167-20130531/7511_1 /TAXON_ID=2988 /ORGANISM="Mallomonas Sp, Strain CCMP3275" /LENGTH=230 /DNA_ID=CAMNT_0024599579 /DNA_START=41 /DNA_END=733 /DNA_ORIENTATION=-
MVKEGLPRSNEERRRLISTDRTAPHPHQRHMADSFPTSPSIALPQALDRNFTDGGNNNHGFPKEFFFGDINIGAHSGKYSIEDKSDDNIPSRNLWISTNNLYHEQDLTNSSPPTPPAPRSPDPYFSGVEQIPSNPSFEAVVNAARYHSITYAPIIESSSTSNSCSENLPGLLKEYMKDIMITRSHSDEDNFRKTTRPGQYWLREEQDLESTGYLSMIDGIDELKECTTPV